MKKIFLGLTLAILIVAIGMFGQSSPAYAQNVACLNFGGNFGAGSSNNSIMTLQGYLQNLGYLNYTPTGYFGPLTLAAVQSFQRAHNIDPTGFVGSQTRTALSNLTCGGSSIYNPNPTPTPSPYCPAGYTCTPNNPVTTPVSCPTGYICTPINNPPTSASSIYLSSVSPSSAAVGTQVTVNGTGFTQTGNTVKLNGGTLVSNVSSSNNTSLTFTVPSVFNTYRCSGSICSYTTASLNTGSFALTVSNSLGATSNALNFTVTSTTNTGNSPVINGLGAPTNLRVNETGTWTVQATDPNNSTLFYSVDWGDSTANQCPAGYTPSVTTYGYTCLYSPNGSLSNFQQTSTFTHSYSTPGTYRPVFTVRNPSGQQAQTSASVLVSNTSTSTGSSLSISSVTPSSGPTGTTITIHAQGPFSSRNVLLIGGSEGGSAISTSITTDGNPQSIILTFTIPANVSDPSCNSFTNVYCIAIARVITPGNYTIAVRNSTGDSNSFNFTVTSGNQTGTPTISSINPTSGGVGTTVTLQGSGFTSGGNLVKFGSNGVMVVGSSNGSTLIFGIPSLFSNCTTSSCTGSTVSIANGTYPVIVQNTNGISNSINFTVTSGSQTGAPSISSINPSSGPVGTQVTLTGTRFASSNSISICNIPTDGNPACNYQAINDSSSNGDSIIFYVPSLTTGTYNVRVSNTNGTSNSVTFTVTSGSALNSPSISSLNPASGVVGAHITVNGSNFTSTGNIIHFGSLYNVTANSSDGHTLAFNVPTNAVQGGCTNSVPGTCWSGTPNGVYQVWVQTSSATGTKLESNKINFTVVSAPSLTSLNPTTGSVGYQVIAVGNGFAATGNAVKFGNGYIQNLSSSDHQTIRFTIPSSAPISLCNGGGLSCDALISVTPGTYPVSVLSNGITSNSINFTVVPNPSGYTTPRPTATLTASRNGGAFSQNLTANVGDTIRYVWSSDHGALFSSSYTSRNNATGASCGASTNWIANSNLGTQTGVLSATQANCTFTIVYKVVGAGGNASSTVIIRTNVAGISDAGPNSQTANVVDAIKALMQQVNTTSNLSALISSINALFANLQQITGGGQ